MSIFVPGDNLVFQLESGYGLLRVLAVDEGERGTIWHLLVYDEFYPDVEMAEAALTGDVPLAVRVPHLALTDRAFEKTPAAKLSHRPLSESELAAYREWEQKSGPASERSVQMMLGLR